MKITTLIFGTVFTLLTTVSCNSTKDVEKNNATQKANEKEMVTNGFTKGTIVQSKAEGDCEWTIKLEDGRHFESTELTSNDVKKDNQEVWFKYRPLRRMSKCNKANPVTITEMKLVK